MIKQKIYPSGLKIVVEETKEEFVSFGIGVNCGSVCEKKSELGLAHLCEHLFFKSTKNLDAATLLSRLEFYGAEINAFTDYEFTFYYFKVMNNFFRDCAALYSDMLFNAKFDEKEFELEKQVVLEEMKMYEDNSGYFLADTVYEAAFNKTPFAHKIIGSEDVIKNATTKDVKAFIRRYYKPENITISVAGGIKFKQVEKIVSQLFESNFSERKETNYITGKQLACKIEKRFVNLDKNDKQTNLLIMIKGESDQSKKFMVQNVFANIMGGGLSSRVFSYLREKKGLCYNASVISETTSKMGFLNFNTATKPENAKKALSAIRFLINEAAEKGFSQEELEKAKNTLKSNFLFKYNQNKSIVYNFENILKRKKIITRKEYCKKIDDVSLEDINQFAKQIAKEKQFVVGAIGKNIKLSDLKIFEKN